MESFELVTTKSLFQVNNGKKSSPLSRQELANLDKDSDSRKSAMKALKSYVKGLDSKAIPQFLAQVSETRLGLCPVNIQFH
ncbi:PROTEIN SINE1, partial [Salix koriyanagi]